ncbi:MAG: hypothetical protein HFJ51_06715 [Clostridia bacterium]|nr:hypothetical protein [Clostridia bacterium]
MKNKRVIFGILIVVIFIFSFTFGGKLLNIFEKTNKEENISIQNNMINQEIKDNSGQQQIASFEGTIISIEEDNFGVENPSHLVDYSIYEGDMKWHNEHSVSKDGRLYVTAAYLLCLDNVPIKDNSGREIKHTNLKIGDTIKVFTKNMKYTEGTISNTITSDNLVLIERKN